MAMSKIAFDASMYFRFGRHARSGIVARTCFDAVVSGERTGTTRFPEDGPAQYARWALCRPGTLVRIWSTPCEAGVFRGDSCVIEITEEPRRIQLSCIAREDWSKAEGWSPKYIDALLARGRDFGVQVRFRLETPPVKSQAEFAW
jgi:hypothetical protein